MSKLTEFEMRPRDRLLALARARGSSLASLSELIGRNSSYLQQFMSRGSPRKLEEQDRRKLAEFFAVSEAELGAPGEISSTTSRSVPDPVHRDKPDWIEVPRLAVGASAGPGAAEGDEEPFDSFRFSSRWLREQGLQAANLTSITVEGDSMEPLLRNGDEILVDRTPRAFRDGIHVVRLDDTLMVKRLASAGAGRISLRSDNSAYPPIDVAVGDLEIVGRVVWKSGKL